MLLLPVPLDRSSGLGVTLTSLFREWPRDRLATAYFNLVNKHCDDSLGKPMPIPAAALPVDSYVRRFVRDNGLSLLQGADENAAAMVANKKRMPLNVWLHMTARAVSDLSPVFAVSPWREQVLAFEPEVVYSILGTLRMLKFARRVAAMSRCVVVPHFLDDWLGTTYAEGQFWGLARRQLDRELRELLRRSPRRFCISQEMAREYESRYGGRFGWVMNCVEDSWFEADVLKSEPLGAQRPLEVAYSGSLYLGRSAVMVRIAQAAQRITTPDRGIRILIYTPQEDLARNRRAFAAFSNVRLQSLAPDGVQAALQAADVLLHVESFGAEHTSFTRYSISTKIPQYLACGKPILGVGPLALASMQHLRESGAAVLVRTLSEDLIGAGLRQLLNHGARMRLGAQGRRYAQLHHRGSSVREQFRETLRAAAYPNRTSDAAGEAVR